jgi:hypothetical protein
MCWISLETVSFGKGKFIVCYRTALLLMAMLWLGMIVQGQEVPVDEALKQIMAVEYQRETAPLRELAAEDSSVFVGEGSEFLHSGAYTLTGHDAGFWLHGQEETIGLLLRPLGENLNLTEMLVNGDPQIITNDLTLGVTFNTRLDWATVELRLEVYRNAPGLIHIQLQIVRTGDPPATPSYEWAFVDANFEETAAGMTWYAEPATFAAPIMYGYSETLDATLLYVVDRTALNPLFHVAHISPTQYPGRRGRSFGHGIQPSDLRALPLNTPIIVYDSYLYLTAGQPANETEMFGRFLTQISDIYDLLNKPIDTTLPDWHDLGTHTIRDLEHDEGSWVTLNDQRYARAYWGDTRQSAELISQLDVLSGIVRYENTWGETTALDDKLWLTLPDFFDPDYGMLVNAGPLFLGQQGRGDTWYELGHALRVAELAVETGNQHARELALVSAEQWIDFAHTVDYRFPQFYNFETWQGTGREPDAAGGYALYMLELWQLTGEDIYLSEAQAAVEALEGHGFRLSYETHMTAAGAAACARLYQITGDSHYLDLALSPIANLIRLSWLWESDYGPSIDYRTFWGLLPTQESGVITAKEQYEAWVYLQQYTTIASRNDYSNAPYHSDSLKLATEFLSYTLTTLPYTLPPLLPPEVASPVATTYDTVTENNLALYIPLEDLRHGWLPSGGIGQEVYGAGMAPTLGALAYHMLGEITVYSPVPLLDFSTQSVTFTGTPQNRFPVQIWGTQPQGVNATRCGDGWCFLTNGQQVVHFR